MRVCGLCGAQQAHPAEVSALSSILEKLRTPECGCAKCRELAYAPFLALPPPVAEPMVPLADQPAAPAEPAEPAGDEDMWEDMFSQMRRLASFKAYIKFNV